MMRNPTTELRTIALAPLLGLGLWLGACGAAPGTRPDDMSAAQHRQMAAAEERKAERHEAHYDPSEEVTMRTAGTNAQGDVIYAPRVYNPTRSHLHIAGQHRRHAEEHRAAARALEKFEQEQCKLFPPETRELCPLLGTLESVQNIEGGVRVRFLDGVNMPAATDHVLCHLAYGRTQGRQGMDSCPLYIEGVTAKRVDETRNVDLTVDDPAKVPELRARAAAHVGPEQVDSASAAP